MLSSTPFCATKRDKSVEPCSRTLWLCSVFCFGTLYSLLAVHRMARSELQTWASLIDSGHSLLPVSSYERAAREGVSIITPETREHGNATAEERELKNRRANGGDQIPINNEEQLFSNQTTQTHHTSSISFNHTTKPLVDCDTLEQQIRLLRLEVDIWKKRALNAEAYNRDTALEGRALTIQKLKAERLRKRQEVSAFGREVTIPRNTVENIAEDYEPALEPTVNLTAEQERRRPSRPLCALCRTILAKSRPVNLTYQDVTGSPNVHERIALHQGACDANGTWGYVHDETALRRYPPRRMNYTREQLRTACAKRDDTFNMITRKVKVVTDEDLENQRRQLQFKGARHRPETIFCMIYTVSSYEDRLQRIRETWGPKCDGFLAASNRTDPSINAVHIHHKGIEAHRNMWQKARTMWSYVYDNYYDKYDWFHIGGDDMFLIVENLRYYLESEEIKTAANDGIILPDGSESQQRPLFLGCRLKRMLPHKELYNSGGAGYTLNKAALKMLVVDGLPNYARDMTSSEEDVLVSLTFQKFNVYPYETKDETKAERYNPLPPDELYSGNYDKHHWIRKAGIDVKVGLGYSATHSVSYHFITGDEIYRLHALLYNQCPNDDLNSTMSTISTTEKSVADE